MALLTLNLSQKSLLFLLVRCITLLLLLKTRARQDSRILAQLSDRTFALALVLFLELGKFGTLTIWVVMTFWIEVVFEFGNRCFNSERFVMV